MIYHPLSVAAKDHRIKRLEAELGQALETLKLLYQELSESRANPVDLVDWALLKVKRALAGDSALEEEGNSDSQQQVAIKRQLLERARRSEAAHMRLVEAMESVQSENARLTTEYERLRQLLDDALRQAIASSN